MSRLTAGRGVTVVAAGTGINLALGVLYTWSIFKGAIGASIQGGGADAFAWDPAALNDPYATCLLVFALTMIVAGRCQDRFGPRVTAAIGGVLVGAGFIWLSQTTSYWSWVFGFGGLVGAGIAFGYSAATPAALKWFPPTQTGRITGIVVSGFGLASVYIAPLAIYLLDRHGMSGAMLVFGVAFLIVVTALSTLLMTPPDGYQPKGFVDRRCDSRDNQLRRSRFVERQVAPGEMLRSYGFWALWATYFIGAGAGLMVIGSVAGMAKASLGELAFAAVAILAIGNAAGRIVAGVLSDRVGRKQTLAGMLAFQALLMFVAIPVVGTGDANALLLVLLATFIGFNYGSNLALFPAYTKDLWGIRHLGVNYGILFSAWGLGGFVLSRVSQQLVTDSGSYTGAFLLAGVLLLVAIGLVFTIHDHREAQKQELAGDPAPGTAQPVK